MRLVVLHYHLLPGGVTDVIRDSTRALLAHRNDISEILLICGREENAAAVATAIGPSARFEVWPEVGYAETSESAQAARDRASSIRDRLQGELSADDVLWVHNYHIGKNAGLTLATAELGQIWTGAQNPLLVLHLHDFPEDGRFGNLAYLRRTIGGVPYPLAAKVRYAVINTRDLAVLGSAGVPRTRLSYLPNPIAGDRETRPEPIETHKQYDRLVMGLAAFAREHGATFHPDGPIVLYPVRAIRRKNIIEIATIVRMMEGWNLVVTLPGTSAQETAYSELVAYAFSDRRVHGCFGIGQNEHRYGFTFPELFGSADLIASSSVQEGFGLAFLNTLRARRPLFARKLATMGGLLPMFDDYPAFLYESFRIPLHSPSLSSMRGYLRMRYSERLDEIAQALPDEVGLLEQRLTEMIDSQTIDFSFLPAQMQLTVLGDIRDDAYGAEVRSINSDLFAGLQGVARAAVPDVEKRLDSAFGFEQFAQRFDEMITGSGDSETAVNAEPEQTSPASAIRTAFAGVDQARLLLGPLDHD
jgi:hypothetical protein